MAAPADKPKLQPLDEAFQRRLRTLSLASRHTSRIAFGRGQHRSRSLGPGTEFADYREYSAGDDYRHIDWNAYARSERLLVRQHEQETELSVSVLLDCSASMGTGDPPKLDYALQLTAAIAQIALQRSDRLALVAIRDRIVASFGSGPGVARAHGAFEFLRTLEASGPTSLATACRAFCARTRRRGLAVLVSDLYDPAGVPPAIDVLRRARFDVRVIRVVDPAEHEGLAPGEYELIDSETERSRQLSITPEVRAAYRAARDREAFALRRACLERHVPLYAIETNISPEEAVLSRLRQAGMFQ
ncbi:MAG TPA: DUF58 domain-containing protein [Polyangiales bacterium]|nr:DUF58 domain-containing protein [Polyangiales bacterium]